jgi:hypothetical protein
LIVVSLFFVSREESFSYGRLSFFFSMLKGVGVDFASQTSANRLRSTLLFSTGPQAAGWKDCPESGLKSFPVTMDGVYMPSHFTMLRWCERNALLSIIFAAVLRLLCTGSLLTSGQSCNLKNVEQVVHDHTGHYANVWAHYYYTRRRIVGDLVNLFSSTFRFSW